MAEPLYVVKLIAFSRIKPMGHPLYLNIVGNSMESRMTADWLNRRCATELPRAVAQAAASVVSFLRPNLSLIIEEAK